MPTIEQIDQTINQFREMAEWLPEGSQDRSQIEDKIRNMEGDRIAVIGGDLSDPLFCVAEGILS